VHTKPKSQLASRTPIEVGAELYGVASLDADVEIISLMLATVKSAGAAVVHLDLGHVGIYRDLIDLAALPAEAEQLLFDAFDRKAKTEIAAILSAHVADKTLASAILALVDLNGDLSVLQQAKQLLANAPASVLAAIDCLATIAEHIQVRFPATPMYVDLAELRGYQYHTGLVFAAYIEGVGHAVANGGRYDNIGAAFGRARPATGFSANVKALLTCMQGQEASTLIVALENNDAEFKRYIETLRAQGERVIVLKNDAIKPAHYTHIIVNEKGQWQIKPVS